jgi:hypothetical protein
VADGPKCPILAATSVASRQRDATTGRAERVVAQAPEQH